MLSIIFLSLERYFMSVSKDLSGMRIGINYVIALDGYKKRSDGSRTSRWLVRCQICGKESVKDYAAVMKGTCQCQISSKLKGRSKPGLIKDLCGQKFGMLTVLERMPPDYRCTDRFGNVLKKRAAFYRCRCDCGNTVIVQRDNLKSGATQSCGCRRKTVKKSLDNLNVFTSSVYKDGTRLDIVYKTHSNNKTGIRGVYYDAHIRRYKVYVTQKRKRHYGGSFKTLEEASAARERLVHLLYDPLLEMYPEAQKYAEKESAGNRLPEETQASYSEDLEL